MPTLKVVNKEEALWDWVSKPPKQGSSFLFNFLRGQEGSCAIAPVDDRPIRTYVDGTTIREYTFALQIILAVSDADDGTNVENMGIARTWQKYIAQQGASRAFPDFGPKCSDYKLSTRESPQLTQLQSNNQARYDFFATITYREEV